MGYALQGGGNAKRNPGDSTPLYEVVSAIGFTTVQGAGAMVASANSYGGINASAVYLNPRSSGGSGALSVVEPVAGSGSGSGSGGSETPGGGTTGGETPSGGGTNTGGGDNGGGGDDEPGGDDH